MMESANYRLKSEDQVEKDLPWHQKLKRERMLYGWSQADVAEKIGTTTKTVARWEQGNAFPGPYLRQNLMLLFEKSAEELGLIEKDVSKGSKISVSAQYLS